MYFFPPSPFESHAIFEYHHAKRLFATLHEVFRTFCESTWDTEQKVIMITKIYQMSQYPVL